MKLYEQSDIFVLPTWHEGFPHSIWEAAATSLPIFVTKVGGITGIVNDELVNFCQVHNPKDIAQKIANALAFPDATNAKTEKMFEFSKGFSVQQCATKLLTHFSV
jgi:glycosyltransferase involved in cell wall biosynthesis